MIPSLPLLEKSKSVAKVNDSQTKSNLASGYKSIVGHWSFFVVLYLHFDHLHNCSGLV